MGKQNYGDFSSREDVLDYISEFWELFDGEGLDEAYKAFVRLPVDRRTTAELERICKGIAPADIDFYDDADFIPRV
jgi:hypothetical protein